jgi:hypothetical protein
MAKRNARAALLKSGLAFGLSVASVAWIVTGAIFTDSASIDGNAFSTGDVEIATSPTSQLVTFTNPEMVPGDKVTDDVTVTNAGTVQLRYAVTSVTTEDVLAGQLDLTIKSGVTACTNGGFAADGVSLYTGDLGSVAGVDLVGDPSQGSQTGDRTLAASVAEVLCFQVSLPVGTTSSYENLDTTATFAFDAEQVASNP